MERRSFLGILGGLIVAPKFGRFYRPNPIVNAPAYILDAPQFGVGFKITRQMIESSPHPGELLARMRRYLAHAAMNQFMDKGSIEYESTKYEEWDYKNDQYIERIISKPKGLKCASFNADLDQPRSFLWVKHQEELKTRRAFLFQGDRAKY